MKRFLFVTICLAGVALTTFAQEGRRGRRESPYRVGSGQFSNQPQAPGMDGNGNRRPTRQDNLEQRWRAAKSSGQKTKIVSELSKQLGKTFDDDMARRKRQIAEIEQRLDQLKRLYTKRQRAKSKIVKLQAHATTMEWEGLGFAKDSDLGNNRRTAALDYAGFVDETAQFDLDGGDFDLEANERLAGDEVEEPQPLEEDEAADDVDAFDDVELQEDSELLDDLSDDDIRDEPFDDELLDDELLDDELHDELEPDDELPDTSDFDEPSDDALDSAKASSARFSKSVIKQKPYVDENDHMLDRDEEMLEAIHRRYEARYGKQVITFAKSCSRDRGVQKQLAESLLSVIESYYEHPGDTFRDSVMASYHRSMRLQRRGDKIPPKFFERLAMITEEKAKHAKRPQPDYAYVIARLKQAGGKMDRAIAYQQAAVELAPENKEYREFLNKLKEPTPSDDDSPELDSDDVSDLR